MSGAYEKGSWVKKNIVKNNAVGSWLSAYNLIYNFVVAPNFIQEGFLIIERFKVGLGTGFLLESYYKFMTLHCFFNVVTSVLDGRRTIFFIVEQ